LTRTFELESYFRTLNKKIAYNLSLTGLILMQIYVYMYLT